MRMKTGSVMLTPIETSRRRNDSDPHHLCLLALIPPSRTEPRYRDHRIPFVLYASVLSLEMFAQVMGGLQTA